MILPKRIIGCAAVLLFVFGFVSLARSSPFLWLVYLLVPEPKLIPYISHVVLFQFKQGTSAVDIKEVSSKMMSLKKRCVHPNTRLPYIVSITGGKDISIEKSQDGFTHAFVLRFYSKEDRNYYVEHDPVHQAFKEATSLVLERFQVIDFEEGVFH